MKIQSTQYVLIGILIVALFGIALNASAINYYVDAEHGSLSNDGKSMEKAFKRLSQAADKTVAGDTVFVMNGTYTNSPGNALVIETSSGTSDKWIVWMNYPGHKPLLYFDFWQCFFIKGSYVEINGLTIKGQNSNYTLEEALNQPRGCANPTGSYNAVFNGNGIMVDGRNGDRVHHITIKNCTVFDCGGSGIQFIESDYITIDNNLVYNNQWYGLFAGSGISLLNNYNSDKSKGTKNFIINNISHSNHQYVPWPGNNCRYTDGNGIIIDRFDNTTVKLDGYIGRTLVANNVVYNNGGSGIHAFHSFHVDIVNNTSYKNSQSEYLDDGQIFASKSDDIIILNNIIYAHDGNKINSNYSNGDKNKYDFNLHNDASAILAGNHTIVGDPLFTDPENGDFTLQAESPAIDAGTYSIYGAKIPSRDINNVKRPTEQGIDIGAYEYSDGNPDNDLILGTDSDYRKFIMMYPNPASDVVSVAMPSKRGQDVHIAILNLMGQLVSESTFIPENSGYSAFQLDASSLSNGRYLVRIENGTKVDIKNLTVMK